MFATINNLAVGGIASVRFETTIITFMLFMPFFVELTFFKHFYKSFISYFKACPVHIYNWAAGGSQDQLSSFDYRRDWGIGFYFIFLYFNRFTGNKIFIVCRREPSGSSLEIPAFGPRAGQSMTFIGAFANLRRICTANSPGWSGLFSSFFFLVFFVRSNLSGS